MILSIIAGIFITLIIGFAILFAGQNKITGEVIKREFCNGADFDRDDDVDLDDFTILRNNFFKSGPKTQQQGDATGDGKVTLDDFVALKQNWGRVGDCFLSEWDLVRANDIADVPEGWAEPTLLEVNTDGIEDSAFITLDGETLHFMHYPGDITAQPTEEEVGTYESKKPFITKTKIAEGVYSQMGMQITASGDRFYSNPTDSIITAQKGDDDIFRNDEVLPFNTDEDWVNAHYCEAKDELWFDSIRDKEISILKNAAANNFDGIPELAPYPINDNGSNFQAHLTPDCDIIYFTSERGPGHISIVKSERQADDSWSEPEVVISSKVGVGEPTLTADGNQLFFVQVFQNDEGISQIDILYTEKIQ